MGCRLPSLPIDRSLRQPFDGPFNIPGSESWLSVLGLQSDSTRSQFPNLEAPFLTKVAYCDGRRRSTVPRATVVAAPWGVRLPPIQAGPGPSCPKEFTIWGRELPHRAPQKLSLGTWGEPEVPPSDPQILSGKRKWPSVASWGRPEVTGAVGHGAQ